MVLKRRHLLKAVTWRIIATSFTILLTIAVTGDARVGLIVGPIDLIIKLIMYYVHERCWVLTKFGITTATTIEKPT